MNNKYFTSACAKFGLLALALSTPTALAGTCKAVNSSGEITTLTGGTTADYCRGASKYTWNYTWTNGNPSVESNSDSTVYFIVRDEELVVTSTFFGRELKSTTVTVRP